MAIETYTSFDSHRIIFDFILNKRSGTLTFTPGVRKLFFEEGNLVFANSEESGEHFSDILVEMEILNKETLEEVKSSLGAGESLGKKLKNLNLASSSQLAQALKHQITSVVEVVFSIAEGEYETSSSLPGRLPKLKIQMLALVIRTITSSEAPAYLENLPSDTFCASENFDQQLLAAPLPANYEALLEFLRDGTPSSFDDICQHLNWDRRLVEALAYVLNLTGATTFSKVIDDTAEEDFALDSELMSAGNLQADSPLDFDQNQLNIDPASFALGDETSDQELDINPDSSMEGLDAALASADEFGSGLGVMELGGDEGDPLASPQSEQDAAEAYDRADSEFFKISGADSNGAFQEDAFQVHSDSNGANQEDAFQADSDSNSDGAFQENAFQLDSNSDEELQEDAFQLDTDSDEELQEDAFQVDSGSDEELQENAFQVDSDSDEELQENAFQVDSDGPSEVGAQAETFSVDDQFPAIDELSLDNLDKVLPDDPNQQEPPRAAFRPQINSMETEALFAVEPTTTDSFAADDGFATGGFAADSSEEDFTTDPQQSQKPQTLDQSTLEPETFNPPAKSRMPLILLVTLLLIGGLGFWFYYKTSAPTSMEPTSMDPPSGLATSEENPAQDKISDNKATMDEPPPETSLPNASETDSNTLEVVEIDPAETTTVQLSQTTTGETDPGVAPINDSPINDSPINDSPINDSLAPAQGNEAQGSIRDFLNDSASRFKEQQKPYSIALMTACERGTLERFLATNQEQSIFLFAREYQGRKCYLLCWGAFATVNEAEQSKANAMPEHLRSFKGAWVKKFATTL